MQLPDRQRGVVLAVAMIFLLLMTILGISSLGTTTLEERMAGNMMSQNIAFQGAEYGIAEGAEDPGNWSVADDGTQTDSYLLSSGSETFSGVTWARTFLQTTEVGRQTDTADGASTTQHFHFRIDGRAKTKSNAYVANSQGVYKSGPGSTDVLLE